MAATVISVPMVKALRDLAAYEARYPKALGSVEGVDVRVATADALVRRGLAARTSKKVTRTTRHRDGFGSDFYWRTRDVTEFYVTLTAAGRAVLAAEG